MRFSFRIQWPHSGQCMCTRLCRLMSHSPVSGWRSGYCCPPSGRSGLCCLSALSCLYCCIIEEIIIKIHESICQSEGYSPNDHDNCGAVPTTTQVIDIFSPSTTAVFEGTRTATLATDHKHFFIKIHYKKYL